MNKTLTSWLSVVVVFLCLPLYAWNGSGTYEDPYEINTASDVADLVVAVNGGASQSGIYFLQTADIDLSSFGNFTPIGSASAPFKGSYDGDGYYFSNLFITASVASTATTNAFGLFGYVVNATIENVNVQGKIEISADYNAGACVAVGGVVGLSEGTIFAALKNYADIDVKINSTPSGSTSNNSVSYGVGGCVGILKRPNATFLACENYGDIYVDGANGRCFVGGCCSAFSIKYTGSITTISSFNNFGKIIVNAKSETSETQTATVGGVFSFMWAESNGDSTRIPTINHCSNFGSILCSNSVSFAGVVSKGYGGGNHTFYCYNSTNRADIVSVVESATGRNLVGGVCADNDNYLSPTIHDCVNFGTITAKGNGVGITQVGGVFASKNAEQTYTGNCYGCKNFGDIKFVKPRATSCVVGGVSSSIRRQRLKKSFNFGNIDVQTDGSVLIGGVSSVSGYGNAQTTISDCVNFGGITANGNTSTNYSPCVGGVVASTRLVGTYTRSYVISNCYNIGAMKLNLNADDCYGAIYGVANTYGNYSVSIKNCYAVVGEGQNLIGAVDASNGQVSLENCVGIKSGNEGGIAYSVIGSNNWSQVGTTLVSYDDCYHTPSLCLGNMASGIFFPAEKSADFFDLILPINTQLYPTPSDQDKKDNSFTKAQGYKRYIRTIQQQ